MASCALPRSPRIHVVRYALDSSVLSLVTQTLPVAEAARRRLLGIYGRLVWRCLHWEKPYPAEAELRPKSEVFSGKDASGDPLAGHRHAYYLPTDEDGDGRLDHLTVYAAKGFGQDERRAFDRLRELLTGRDGEERHSLRLFLLSMGASEEYGPGPLRASEVWVSATPYIATRYAKTRGRDRIDVASPEARAAFLQDDLRAQLAAVRPDPAGEGTLQVTVEPMWEDNHVFKVGATQALPPEARGRRRPGPRRRVPPDLRPSRARSDRAGLVESFRDGVVSACGRERTMSTSDDLRERTRKSRIDVGAAGAPAYESLPQPTRRSTRGGSALCAVSVTVEVVTPIFGGSSQTRVVDEVEVIRPATVRGNLRFWWRALRGHECANARELYEEESDLWGRAVADKGGRSAVEIRIEVQRAGGIDNSDIHLVRTPGAYALWPARAEKRTSTPPAPRREPGTRFLLTLIAPADREAELRNVIRAWLLFGGYGSRTRRGLGSLAVTDEARAWLPAQATRNAFEALFGRDVFAPPSKEAIDTPWLAGAALHVGKADKDVGRAWTTALDWLKKFRQGTSDGSGDRAREPGTGKLQPQRPSISNWPEADKVRHLKERTSAHPPRHNTTPAWPRAGFGLPIIGQFQTKARDGNRMDGEPGAFELRWRSGSGDHDRLASPLIVKALPLADGTFVPCALWLMRDLPAGAEVGLARPKSGGRQNEKEVDQRSAAPFDRLVAPGDTPRFSALDRKSSLREAFLEWLHARYETTMVAP